MIKLPSIEKQLKQIAAKANILSWESKQVSIILLTFFSIGLFYIAFWSGTRPVGGEEITITIKEGESRSAIADNLRQKGLIRSRPHFLLVSYFSSGAIKSGVYSLSQNANLYEIVESLKLGEHALTKITIPEGWRREQIALAISKEGFDSIEFMNLTKDKEGYLFPDTYFLKKEATAEEIVAKFAETFEMRTKELKPTREQLILASIVERESNQDDQRALIAGIYQNRVNKKISLEADPTVQYAKDSIVLAAGQVLDSFWPTITVKDYHAIQSPYNTYLIPSLPPGPICNPGIKSIEAAMNPEETDAVYFFHTADGTIITSKTFEEHRAKVQKYM